MISIDQDLKNMKLNFKNTVIKNFLYLSKSAIDINYRSKDMTSTIIEIKKLKNKTI